MTSSTRDDLAQRFLDQLPYPPYPLQEEALLTWFTAEQGVMVCAPTGTGKTLIAHAALFEALHTDSVAYYTTPLIALTEQKFQEMQASAVRWGFRAEDVGLVTGNRKVNPEAKVLVVVAEILLNRLLNPGAFDFSKVSAVVMDEFHSFADQERGIVWELSLGMLPPTVRLMLLSATVGNALEFLAWLNRSHGRKLELVEGKERKIPLSYHWEPDAFLTEHMVEMAKGDPDVRRTPALIFCFNRDECWSVAEQLKGLPLLSEDQRKPLLAEVAKLDWTQGVGPKMKQLIQRGVGVHHAGMLPKYRRAVEHLFEKKLLAVAVCTETLAAGINLPARSIVMSSLVKGPRGKEKLVDPSTAHQIFGRAGRPQFDTHGHVYAVAHEDDVRILRWKRQYDQIPENAKDPGSIKARKTLNRKKPSRVEGKLYWTEGQFKQMQGAPPGKLYSKGPLPWRLLAYLLQHSPEVSRLRTFIRKRLMDEPRIAAGEKALTKMLLTLAAAGYVTLQPTPPPELLPRETKFTTENTETTEKNKEQEKTEKQGHLSLSSSSVVSVPSVVNSPGYSPELAIPTPNLEKLLVFRSVHPLYGAFLVEQLGIADRDERIQAFESVLEMPRPLLKFVRVPYPDQLPPGPLAMTRLDPELLKRGLIAPPVPAGEEDDEDDWDWWKEPERPVTFADKLKLLFDALYPDVIDVNVLPVWSAGELFRYGGLFNKYVQAKDLTKQEGIIFRHFLRLILMLEEFAMLTPSDTTAEAWQADLREIRETLTDSCRQVDPSSTDEMIKKAHAADVVEGEEAMSKHPPLVGRTPPTSEETSSFGAGIFDQP